MAISRRVSRVMAQLLSVLAVGLAFCAHAGEIVRLVSGDAELSFTQIGGAVTPSISVDGRPICDGTASRRWIGIEFGGQKLSGAYSKASRSEGQVTLTAVVKATDLVSFTVTDVFSAEGGGEFRIRRKVTVSRSDGGSGPGFATDFSVESGDRFSKVDTFVPSMMYKNMFDPRAKTPSWHMKADDREFLFREDRLPLPVAMYRRSDGIAVALTLEETGNRTVLADSRGERTNDAYRFGGVGFTCAENDSLACHVTYPGCDRRTGGMGPRFLKSSNGTQLEYSFRLALVKTASYGAAVERMWNRAVELYDPPIFKTDSEYARKALLDTLYSYRMSATGDRDLVRSRYDKSGFPWSVKLEGDFGVCADTYELGFVGAQPVAGYCLMLAGIVDGNDGWRRHGESVIDFWARESLSELGFPNSRYYPIEGRWDEAPCSLRQSCTGMGGILDIWDFLRRRGDERHEWLRSCRRFGDWLVGNQAEDGSWPMEVNPRIIEGGRHPVVRANKATTICAVHYLSRLYAGTGDARYRTAALKAAEFAYDFQHRDYLYVACVVDNPEVFDSESGYEAMKGFLAAYDIDKKKKWLDAARQAAVYTQTWVYMHEVPPEDDGPADTPWPRDRSVVGQHFIAFGHPGADLGFAWTAFWYYRLSHLTGEKTFLRMARIATHNTKQSMNLGGKVYPGRGEGLQCEASTLCTSPGAPRRTRVIKEALTWNFAAHLSHFANKCLSKE